MSILQKIYSSVIRFLVPLSLEETYRVVVDEAIKLAEGQYGTIFRQEKGQLRRVYSSSPLSEQIVIRKGGNRYKSFRKKEALIINARKLKNLTKVHPALKEMHARSILIVPLINQGEAIGLLTVVSRKDKKFSKKDLEVLKLFGSLASLAIRKASLYNEIKESLETRDLFISLAAHELRTPLTTINGYVQLLLAKINSKKPVQKEWVTELALESQRLKILIDEFLEINRIRTGKLQFNWQESSIKDLVNRALTNFKFNFPTRKIIFINELKHSKDNIISDAEKIVQVLINILENAHKYSKKDKEITLSLRSNLEEYVIDITDQGQGIEEKDLPMVFKGFYKGENSRHEGMGLGLYLTKNIIDAHKGEIAIDSKLGKGTTIQIKLPKI